MCFADLLCEIRSRGIAVTEPQIRWAIKSGKVSKPIIDGSLRFVFNDDNVGELVDLFGRTSAEA